MDLQARFRGMLLGTAVGDAVGLPAEGVSRKRGEKMFPGPWQHRLLFGRGMISDDTEHTIFVTQCLLAHDGDADRFVRRLAACLRWWLASLPAGIGLATGRAIFRLWVGISPRKSGVYSAGNGPAMRVAPIGAYFADNPESLAEYTALCTRITHTDPKAEIGAGAISRAAGWIVRDNISQRPEAKAFVELLRVCGEEKDWQELVTEIDTGIREQISVAQFAERLGLSRGVTGYIYHTVPVVLYAWYRHCGDFEKTLTAIWQCGGDTDTTGAIAGALAGLVVGEAGIPPGWIAGIVEWPRGIVKMRAMAEALARKQSGETGVVRIRYFWPGVLPRNLFFLVVVLMHGFRRLLPPY
jgi:ADP-ribosylglycohydrolase